MAGIQKKIDKYCENGVIPVLIFALLSTACAVLYQLCNSDEMWNYTFGTNIANGLLPYRDFNYLQTPFSALVNAIAFKIFGQHLLVMRLMGAALFTLMSWRIYKSCRNMGADWTWSCMVPIALIAMFSTNIFFEYSDLILCFLVTLMGIDIDSLCGKNRRWRSAKYQVLVGIMGGCAMMSKQTYGTFVAVASWISIAAVTLMMGGKPKEALKLSFFRALGTSIPCFIFLFYLLGTGTWDDFYDMSIAGISTFTSTYKYTDLMKENWEDFLMCIGLPALAVFGPVFAFICRKALKGKQAIIIWLYSVFGCINMVPLANSFHVSCTLVPFLMLLVPLGANPLPIPFLYEKEPEAQEDEVQEDEDQEDEVQESIEGAEETVIAETETVESVEGAEVLVENVPAGEGTSEASDAPDTKPVRRHRTINLFKNEYISIIPEAVLMAAIGLFVFYNAWNQMHIYKICEGIQGYELIPIAESLETDIKTVDAYIEEQEAAGKTVYILDNQAVFYFKPLGEYHKYLDMYLVGNLGTKAPYDCLAEAMGEDVIWLTPGKDRDNTQFPSSAVSKLQSNLKKSGEIGPFYIYEAK